MTATRAAATAVTLAAALTLGLSACGDDDPSSDTSPDLDPTSDTTSPADAPTSEPDGAETIPTSYPAVGLEYDGLPDVEGKYRDALETFVAFDRGRLQLLHEAEMNPLVTKNAAEQVVATFRSTATYLQQNDAHYRGTTVASFSDVEEGNDLLGLDLCLDGTELRYVEGGSASAPDGPARVPFRVIVTLRDGTWTVTEASTQEGTC